MPKWIEKIYERPVGHDEDLKQRLHACKMPGIFPLALEKALFQIQVFFKVDSKILPVGGACGAAAEYGMDVVCSRVWSGR